MPTLIASALGVAACAVFAHIFVNIADLGVQWVGLGDQLWIFLTPFDQRSEISDRSFDSNEWFAH